MSQENSTDTKLDMNNNKKMEDLLFDALDVVEKQDVDGFRLIEYKKDGVYLSIHAPYGKGKPLSLETVLKELEERKIQGQDLPIIMQTVREMTGIPVKIAKTQEEVVEDGNVIVTTSKDKMEAYITVYPPKGGLPIEYKKVMEQIKAEGIVFGLDDDKIKKAIELQQVSETVTIAKGQTVQNGKDAKIEFHFETHGVQIKPKELADGRADFYNLNLIQNVNRGQILVTKTPPTPGQMGKTVKGEDILPKGGKDYLIQTGKNTEFIEDNLTIIASTEGHVLLQGNKISVSPIFEVNGDVDFGTGNIDFNGSVIIKGSIKPGFIVKASGDLEILDSISGGFVYCGGHVKVKNGIQGNQKGQVYANGNIFAKFIENANVYAGGSILIGEAIMHSHIEAKKMVVVGGKKGLIVGGLVRAGEEVEAKIIGSSLATATEIEAGVNPEKRKEYIDVCKNFEQNEQNLDKALKAIKLLKQMEVEFGELSQDKKAMLVKLTRTQFQLMNDNLELKEKKQLIEDELEQLQHGKIKVSGIIHPGVKVTIGNAITYIRDDIKFVCIVKDQGQVRLDSYK